LLDAILTSNLKPVGGFVDVNAFMALSLDERKWLTGATWNVKRQRWTSSGSPNRPYYLGFIECLEGAAHSVKKPGWQVSFCFDQQNVLAPWALLFFQAVKSHKHAPLSKRLGDAIFKDKSGVGGLQAADMLAHTIYRLTSTTFTPANIAPELKVVRDAFHPLVRNRIAIYDKGGLAMRLTERERKQREGYAR
jgi:hypothetical protein